MSKAKTVTGESNVAPAGSHAGKGRNKDDVRDHASLRCSGC